MSTKKPQPVQFTPGELKTLFEALNASPSYFSKRFILKHMLGFTDEQLAENVRLMSEENELKKMGNKGIY